MPDVPLTLDPMEQRPTYRLSAKAAILWGIGLLVAGFFFGGHLRGLELFGFILVLAGALTMLFGVLRFFADRAAGNPAAGDRAAGDRAAGDRADDDRRDPE